MNNMDQYQWSFRVNSLRWMGKAWIRWSDVHRAAEPIWHWCWELKHERARLAPFSIPIGILCGSIALSLMLWGPLSARDTGSIQHGVPNIWYRLDNPYLWVNEWISRRMNKSIIHLIEHFNVKSVQNSEFLWGVLVAYSQAEMATYSRTQKDLEFTILFYSTMSSECRHYMREPPCFKSSNMQLI